MAIPVYSLTWHLQQSSAFHELVTLPLSPYVQFEQRGWDEDGALPEFQMEWLKSSPIVFFQLPPPERIARVPTAQIVWIPMWDQARGYDLEWWGRLPKNLRVVSFSDEISQRSKAVGLQTLDVRYSMLPVEGEQANWDKPRTLLYWNRTGMVGEAFLRKLCQTLDVEILLFRRHVDPRQPAWCDYDLPDRFGKTVIKKLTFTPEGVNTRHEYLKYLDQANIFIAPRVSEGVGLTFIEAMARGCAVFACDAPTMNEYITHKTNGYLFKKLYPSTFNAQSAQISKLFFRAARRLGSHNFSFEHPVTAWQNWAEIKKLDLRALGISALRAQVEGYTTWRNILPQYASFIMDW